MNKRKASFPSKYILLLFVLICIVLVILSSATGFAQTPVGRAVGAAISPVQKAVTSAGNWVEEKSSLLRDKEELLAENERLQAQIDELTQENAALKTNSSELEALRALYALDNEYTQYPKIAATVIGKDTGNWFQNFIIDKGSADGIEVDMNVIANGGLVGRVTAVGSDWARVCSIIDDASNVSAMTQTTGDYCVVSGDLELYEQGMITLSKLYDSDDNTVVGEMLVTSNISETYLPGLLIGYISALTVDSNNTTKSGTVSLAVDFEHIKEVFVITQLK